MKTLRGRGGGGEGEIGKVKGRGVESGYRTKGLITMAGLPRFCRDPGTLGLVQKSNFTCAELNARVKCM